MIVYNSKDHRYVVGVQAHCGVQSAYTKLTPCGQLASADNWVYPGI